jgi:biopolymer transport protein ExbB/TolQ
MMMMMMMMMIVMVAVLLLAIIIIIIIISSSSSSSRSIIKTPAKESLGLHELKQHKSWFDKYCVGFLDQRKQAKRQWIQDPSRSNVDNLNNVRRDASRYFRKNRRHV